MIKKLLLLFVIGLASLSWGQSWTITKSYGAAGTTNAINTGAQTFSYTVTWTKSGTVSGCTVQVETASTYAGSYSAIGAAQTCTASGNYSVTGASTGYVRLNMTSWTGTGTVVVTVKISQPSGGYSSAAVISCGAALAANGACANTTPAAPAHVVYGSAVLASNASTITGIAPAFTSTSTFFCVGNDVTTRANPVQVVPASGSSITITNTTGATDTIQYICVGY